MRITIRNGLDISSDLRRQGGLYVFFYCEIITSVFDGLIVNLKSLVKYGF